ncbi:hypothetical protein TrVE_jg10856 [Triparma verrucosa]|uniref:Methyltransferase domain-containing protein n=1 Tax=Triparma verrucosa TaxID=1606542 RepID=A0A9W7BRX0_9STRA|nr:hypothetical protein TrVE_jg10856 [Triparma verrucosa]
MSLALSEIISPPPAFPILLLLFLLAQPHLSLQTSEVGKNSLWKSHLVQIDIEGDVLPPLLTTAENWHQNVLDYGTTHNLDPSTMRDLRDAVITRLPAAALDGTGSVGRTRTDLIKSLSSWISHSEGRKINYLEIGCAGGDNFVPISEEDFVETAYCVDPDPKSESTHKMMSEEFFRINEKTWDVVFVDGLHQWSTALNDIDSALLSLSPSGVVIVHDSNPRTSAAASPDVPDWGSKHQHQMAWNGDVFKAVISLGSRRDVDVATGHFDEGCAVVMNRPRSIERLLVPSRGAAETLTFDEFEENRKAFLNLMEWDSLMRWIDPTGTLGEHIQNIIKI